MWWLACYLLWVVVRPTFNLMPRQILFSNVVPLAFKLGLKVGLLRVFGARIGSGAVIKPRVTIKYPWKLEVGDHVWIGEQAWIDNLDRVVIGSHVCISQGALLLCGNHDYTKATFDLMTGPIVLEDGVWMGAKSAVMPGVTCQSHAVLTAGSMATSDLDPYTIYQGCPAQAVKPRTITP